MRHMILAASGAPVAYKAEPSFDRDCEQYLADHRTPDVHARIQVKSVQRHESLLSCHLLLRQLQHYQ